VKKVLGSQTITVEKASVHFAVSETVLVSNQHKQKA
jgi:hypothetical protein